MKGFTLNTNQKGYLFPNVFALVAVVSGNALLSFIYKIYGPLAGNTWSTLFYSEFIIVPILMGIMSAWHWRGLNLSGWTLTWRSCINAFYAIILCWILLRGGMIYLIVVFPLIIVLLRIGMLIGLALFKRGN